MGARKPYLDAITFHWEGAFRAHDPVEAAAYGYNITNFLRDVPELWAHIDKRGMHPDVVKQMSRIAAGGSDARPAAQALFEGLGARTQAFAKGRTNDIPINQSPDTLNYLDSMKRVIAPLTERNYNHKYGLGALHNDQQPKAIEYLRHEAMDSMFIRPHSGVWCLVYAATHAGLLSDVKAMDLGYKYISPKDANVPPIISGIGTLPPEREKDRAKGKAYQFLKPELAEIINHASAAQMQAMQYYMHEARVKFFQETVKVEGVRAAYGDKEAATLYNAHTKKPPTQGWLDRANDSFHYYHPQGLPRPVKHIEAPAPSAPPAQANSWLGDMACGLVGAWCASTPKPARTR